ncbi:hypothetical protein HJFPF1_01094 [Paramyrothecium foliicola]|nr:hypothetical protein HJFPF1_01094 [Paramyrothecium foliicola]
MRRTSLDGRASKAKSDQRAKSTIAFAEPLKSTNKVELKPASPPKINPWHRHRTNAEDVIQEQSFPPLSPPFETPPKSLPICNEDAESQDSAHSCSTPLSPEVQVGSRKGETAETASSTSTSSRKLFEEAAPRAGETLWTHPFGADVLVHADSTIFQVHRVEICEHNELHALNIIHIPRCVLGYLAAVWLRVDQMMFQLVKTVEKTAIELGEYLRTKLRNSRMSEGEAGNFMIHLHNALEVAYGEPQQKLMEPMRMALASLLDTCILFVLQQPNSAELPISKSVRYVPPNPRLFRRSSSMRDTEAQEWDKRSHSDDKSSHTSGEDSEEDDHESRKSESASSKTSSMDSAISSDDEKDIFESLGLSKPWYNLDSSSEEESVAESGQSEGNETFSVGTGNGQLLRVFSTHYTGNAELFSDHGAVLTSIHGPQDQRRPLFKWLHIRQELMNFDEFWLTTSRHARLSQEEANAVAKLKAKVKKQCVRSITNSKGARVGYIETRYVDVPLQSSAKKLGATDESPTARWICLPFFSLRPYSGLLSASDAMLFPNQTLLQTLYSRNTQQRDMEQVVCQLGTRKPGECFHVEQLWCLVLGNGLLVTCGTMDRSALEDEILELSTEPSRQPPRKENLGTIRVMHGSSTMWLFSAEECSTWFLFLNQFHEVWPEVIKVKHNGQTVDGTNWAEMLNLAKRRPFILKLDLTIDSSTRRPSRGVLNQGTPGKDNKMPATEPLHVLTLSTNDSKLRASNDLPPDLVVQLDSADKYLSGDVYSSLRSAYRKCSQASRQTVYDELAEAIKQQQDDNRRRQLNILVDMFNAADDLFQLFFPASFEGPTIGKFWGAIQAMISHKTRHSGRIVWMAGFSKIFKEIRNFQSTFSYANKQERAKLNVPQEFLTAWLYALSATVDCAISGTDRRQHFGRSEKLITAGIQQMVNSISKTSLRDKAMMLPMEVMSLVSLKLLKDQVTKSDDVVETYTQYLNSLDIDITAKPSEKPYQQQLNLVQQELNAVRGVLTKQRTVIESLRSKLPINEPVVVTLEVNTRRYDRSATQPYQSRIHSQAYNPYSRTDQDPRYNYSSYEAPRLNSSFPPRVVGRDIDELDFAQNLESAARLPPTDRGGFRALFLTECAHLIAQREIDIQRCSEFATELERSVAFKMNWVKDRQENAIFAFTIVTIIFLPLSSIASIFGMNTTDVRDMPFSQWLYWAVAIPVTMAIIVAGLWWMNELGNVVGWVTGKRTRRPDARYAGLVSPQAFDSWASVRPDFEGNNVAPAADYTTYGTGMATQGRSEAYPPLTPMPPPPQWTARSIQPQSERMRRRISPPI